MFSGRTVTPTQLVTSSAIYLLLVLNTPFLQALANAVQATDMTDYAFTAAVAVVLLCAYVLVLTVFTVPYVLKPLLVVLIIATASIAYFMHEYGIVIDFNMVRNTFETNQAEAADLITAKLVASIAVFGVLPAALVAWVPVSWPSFPALFMQNLKRAGVVGFIGIVVLGGFYAEFASFFRENRIVLQKLAPSNAVSATLKYAQTRFAAERGPVVPFATDARKGAHWSRSSRPAVVVVVIGETARADRFSLNGYEKATNPLLSKVDGLLNFGHVTSCGTDTADSVPCIFSGLGHDHFSPDAAARREDLLDIAKRAGVSVLWRENQTGCKGVCDRVPSEVLTNSKDDRYCSDGECHDEILLDGLPDKLRAMKDGGLVVLHMMGSHGPAYYKRYPAAFATFQPTCKTSQFSHCNSEEISNAFDNTILYTDYVLAKLIASLKDVADGGIDTAMIYASDHGESLGEKGLYLHGMPYSLAPKEQTHVPMVMWLSEPYRTAFGIDGACLQSRTATPYSHDNVFHTVIGMLNIETQETDSRLDILSGCRHERVGMQKAEQSKTP